MMTKLLVIREQMRKMYSLNSVYIRPIFNFIVMLISVVLINVNVGAMSLLKNPAVVIVISLVGAFLPGKFLILLIAFVLLAHLSAIAIEIAAMMFLIILIMYMLFIRFTPKDSAVLLLIPLLFLIKIPFVVPIVVGLVCTPFSIISVSFGVVIFSIINYIASDLEAISMAAKTDSLNQMTKIASGVFTSKSLYLIIIAFTLVVLVVYFVKRLSIDYSWTVAVVTGGVLCIIIMLIGALAFDMDSIISVVSIVIGGFLSIVLALGIRFFIHSVDYSRTEHTQFEDDDFYYYVKAVPKIKVTSPEVNVKRINARKVRKVKK